MLFGIGVKLTDDELCGLEEVLSPGYAALVFENDFFSFDREFQEREERLKTDPSASSDEPMTNAVWLCMQWFDQDVSQAKETVRSKTIEFETVFLRRKAAYLDSTPRSTGVRQCLDGLSQMIIGNVAWSFSCRCYHPDLR